MPAEVQDFHNFLSRYLTTKGLNADFAIFLNMLVNLALVIILWYIVHYITKTLLLKILKKLTDKTKTTFDDFLVKSNFPKYVSNIIPLLLLIGTVPLIFEEYPRLLKFLGVLIDIYIVVLVVFIARSLLRTTTDYMKRQDRYSDKPIESYSQVLMIVFWALGFISIFSELTGKSVTGFLISLGAASAVILLIFKDTILGFIASIQVSVNDMVRIGDWISFSTYGADGFVTEITLATVKVQNWDNTFTTIPTYSLIAESFNNWRGMQDSPGRRIKRSLFIKQSSIRFVNDQDLERFEQYSLIAPYIKERQQQINTFNIEMQVNKKQLINGRHQTNLGIFREYALSYIKNEPRINQEMTVMVRHLDPTTQGIPIEIYCFSRDKSWTHYEEVMSDIFDHLIASIPYFDLKIFEAPAGDDIMKAAQIFQSQNSSTGVDN